MCGMVGVRDAFYSKTKRFCSVSCSRSYSSNSKKASILARLQVNALSLINKYSTFIILYYVNINICFGFYKGKPPTKKAKVLQKQPLMAKLAAYAQYQASQQNQAKLKAGRLWKSNHDGAHISALFDVHKQQTNCCFCQWSLERVLTGGSISVAVTRWGLLSAVSSM